MEIIEEQKVIYIIAIVKRIEQSEFRSVIRLEYRIREQKNDVYFKLFKI